MSGHFAGSGSDRIVVVFLRRFRHWRRQILHQQLADLPRHRDSAGCCASALPVEVRSCSRLDQRQFQWKYVVLVVEESQRFYVDLAAHVTYAVSDDLDFVIERFVHVKRGMTANSTDESLKIVASTSARGIRIASSQWFTLLLVRYYIAVPLPLQASLLLYAEVHNRCSFNYHRYYFVTEYSEISENKTTAKLHQEH